MLMRYADWIIVLVGGVAVVVTTAVVLSWNNRLGKPLKGGNLLLTNRNSATVWWSDIGQAARRCGIFSRWLSA
jgi:hypothetical protein